MNFKLFSFLLEFNDTCALAIFYYNYCFDFDFKCLTSCSQIYFRVTSNSPMKACRTTKCVTYFNSTRSNDVNTVFPRTIAGGDYLFFRTERGRLFDGGDKLRDGYHSRKYGKLIL